ncbi:MAG: amidohydrolase family protein, partial [Pseudoxanthomonas sp.]
MTASLLLFSLLTANAAAQDVLIRHATVHTAGPQGTLQNADVLVQGGVIRAVGANLQAPASVSVVEADGKPLTPAFFGGITEIGIEEVSGEAETVDSAVTLATDQPIRPEFDVTLAYNPESVLIPVARVEGLGFTLLGANTGGSFIAGQGGVVRLDGSADPIGPRVLFVKLGNDVLGKSGSSRAAQWMLLDQMLGEARGRIPADSPHALLTPAGRAVLARYLAGNGRIVVNVNRAADIRQLLRWAQRENVRIAIASGVEAWKLAPEIARAKVPVFVDALADLPGDFDQIGATLQNA